MQEVLGGSPSLKERQKTIIRVPAVSQIGVDEKLTQHPVVEPTFEEISVSEYPIKGKVMNARRKKSSTLTNRACPART